MIFRFTNAKLLQNECNRVAKAQGMRDKRINDREQTKMRKAAFHNIKGRLPLCKTPQTAARKATFRNLLWHSVLRSGRDVAQQADYILKSVGNKQVAVHAAADYALAPEVVEHGYERTPETTDIVQDYTLAVVSD